MGYIQKKDEDKDYVDGIEVIGRGEGPDGDDDPEALEFDLHEGATAEDISGTTAAREGELETEADPELLSDVEDEVTEDVEDEVAEDVEDEEPAAEEAEAESEEPEADPELESAEEPKPKSKKKAKSEKKTVSKDKDTKDEAKDEKKSESKPKAKNTKSKAKKKAETKAAASVEQDAKSTPADNRSKMIIVGGIAAIVIAAVIGYFIGAGGFGSKGLSTATFAEDQLDTVVATWAYNGAKHDITAREAIESQYSLESVVDEDGNYPAPSADTIISHVRNELILAEAENQGITASDEEIDAAAESQLGTSDYEEIASQYGVTEEQAKDIMGQQVLFQKLYSTVVKDTAVEPEAPAEPKEGEEDKATAEYAEYIIDLAGDEWSAKAGTWASDDGVMAQAFADSKFDGKTATYEQAQTAFYAAYQAYSVQSSEITQQWTDYVNGLFARANLTIYGLYA